MEVRKLNKKVGIVKKNVKYFEINNTNINKLNKKNLSEEKITAIKVNIREFNNKTIIKTAKIIKLIINKYNINTNKYLFFIDKDNIDNISYLNELASILIAEFISDISMRYSYIYDYVSNELDYRFNTYNICDFKNNLCSRKRCLVNKFNIEILKYGCCYTKGRACKYLDKNHCTIDCLPCKFFTCNYLKKKGYKYSPSDFSIINYFFNIKQKRILRNSLFTDKDIIINELIKNKSRLFFIK